LAFFRSTSAPDVVAPHCTLQSSIKIALQLSNGVVKLLAKGSAAKLVQQHLVETLANAAVCGLLARA